MIYVVGKWMFAHQWTNDRIFYNLDKDDNILDAHVEEICEKKEEELSVADRNEKNWGGVIYISKYTSFINISSIELSYCY